MTSSNPTGCRLSVVVVAYDMDREIRRTLHSLATPYQRGIGPEDYEVIVVDNGSPEPIDAAVLLGFPGRLRSVRIDPAPPSPAHAANVGIACAAAPLVGLLIDGARIASPGLLGRALRARGVARRPVIATLGWHLGSQLHMQAGASGYDQGVEDRLLEDVGWLEDGYRLFDVSTLAASSRRGYFGPLGESNAVFLAREMWSELGGLDERFVLPGGGRVNHDLFRRACELDEAELVVLLGEGTFHQIHGGAFTSGGGDRAAADAEYRRLRGRPFAVPDRPALYLGSVPPQLAPVLAHSVRWLERQSSRDRS